ncbi:MAG: hypothetical protein JW780_03175 [Clostridiales bacterium]|nr:hypothetical protein [Clostridiales bacterium]
MLREKDKKGKPYFPDRPDNRPIQRSDRHMYFAIAAWLASIIGITADLILGYVEPGSLGYFGIIQSGWADVALWRPSLSMLLASVSFPVYLLGFRVLFEKFRPVLPGLAKTLWVSALFSSCGGVIVHAFFCVPQYVYAEMSRAGDTKAGLRISDGITRMLAPSFIVFLILIAVVLVLLIIAFLSGKTEYPRFAALLSPIPVAAVLSAMRLLFPSSALVLGLATASVHIGMFLLFGFMVIWGKRSGHCQ